MTNQGCVTGAQQGAERHEAAWVRCHERNQRLARRRSKQDWAEAQALLETKRLEVWRQLGMASLFEYLERVFGYDRRDAHERLRVAERLEVLPLVSNALKDGNVRWSAVREITRVAVPNTEAEWLDTAQKNTVREIERMVRGRQPGDLPTDPMSSDATPRVLRYEDVSPSTVALEREAKKKAIAATGGSLSNDEFLALMFRSYLGEPKDEGRSPTQVVLQQCVDCGLVTQQAGAEQIVVEPVVAQKAACDAQVIPRVDEKTHVGPSAETHVGQATETHAETHVGPSAETQVGPSRRKNTWPRPKKSGVEVKLGERPLFLIDGKKASQVIPPAIWRRTTAS